jgi:phage terminase large subunit-like protein
LPNLSTRKPLTDEEWKLLYLYTKELESRGERVPEQSLNLFQDRKKKTWPVDPNGYFVKLNGASYHPSENHKNFIASTSHFVSAFGPRGCGKSGCGSQKALRKIMAGESGAIMNPDFANFKISTWPEFREWLPWSMVVPSQRHRMRPDWEPHEPFVMVFMNGVKVYCKGLKDEDSARGPNINWLWYDEAARDKTGGPWRIAIPSVRVGKNPQIWATYTPKGSQHWTTKFFVDKEMPDWAKEAFAKIAPEGTILIDSYRLTQEDNKDNLPETYYVSLSAAYPSGWLHAREVEGLVADEGGQIGYSSWFKNKTITVLPERIIKKIRSWDTAASEKKVAKDDPDESVGSLLIKFIPKDNPEWLEIYREHILEGQEKQPHFILENQVSGWWTWEKLLEVIKNTAKYDGYTVPVYVDQDPGGAGKNQVAAVGAAFKDTRNPELNTHQVLEVDVRKVGDRVLAANNHWFGVAAEGRMWMAKGSWNDKFLGQLDGFTLVSHDDTITSVTSGMYVLNPAKKWGRLPFVTI